MAKGKALASCAYKKGVECERRTASLRLRRTLLKTWATCVVGSAVAFGLVIGVKEWRSLVTASLGAGSVGVVLTVLVGKD